MNRIKRTAVALLLRLYPERWRREYGAELGNILVNEPFGPAAVFDVVSNALRQQLSTGEPWLIVGTPLLILNLVMVAWKILNPWAYGDDTLRASASLIQRLWFWMPPLSVGYWTILRSPRQGHGGRAAMKTLLFSSWPVWLIALFAADGLSTPTPSVPIFLLPILNLPFAALAGWFGGLIARTWLRMEKV